MCLYFCFDDVVSRPDTLASEMVGLQCFPLPSALLSAVQGRERQEKGMAGILKNLVGLSVSLCPILY